MLRCTDAFITAAADAELRYAYYATPARLLIAVLIYFSPAYAMPLLCRLRRFRYYRHAYVMLFAARHADALFADFTPLMPRHYYALMMR